MKGLLIAFTILGMIKVCQADETMKQKQIYNLTEAVYQLDITRDSGKGRVLISGKVFSGKPQPIPLFGRDVVLSSVEKIKGGSLFFGKDDKSVISFLPDKAREFQVMLDFLIPVTEDSKSRMVSFRVPQSLQNTMTLKLSEEIQLMARPGVKDNGDTYHFSPSDSVEIRFTDRKDIMAESIVNVASISNVRLHGGRALITTHFLPVAALPKTMTMTAPAGSKFISSTLRKSWIKKTEKDTYELSLPSTFREVFSVQFAIEEHQQEHKFAFSPAGIKENTGTEGFFTLVEPDDAQITYSDPSAVIRTSTSVLNNKLVAASGAGRICMRTSPDTDISFKVTRYESVSTPPLVLDVLSFVASFEENGTAMSALIMDVPAEAGPRLKLKSIKGAKVWSLTVNGKKRKVYSDGADTWIVPLDSGISHVELSFLTRGEKLGLRGRLEAVLPETGLPANKVLVALLLPDSKELLTLEGPINADPESRFSLPRGISGKPHFFSGAYYKGNEVTMAVAYKQPVDKRIARKEGAEK